MGLFDFIGKGYKNLQHNIGQSFIGHAAHNIGYGVGYGFNKAIPVAKSIGQGILKAGGAVLDNAETISGVASGVGTAMLFGAPTPVGKSIGVGLLTSAAVLGGVAAIRKGGKVEQGVKDVGATVKTGAETKAMLKEAYK